MAQAVKNVPAMQETQKTRVRSLGQENPLEEEIATHSNILAWEFPWTEEAGGLQFMRSQRAGNNYAHKPPQVLGPQNTRWWVERWKSWRQPSFRADLPASGKAAEPVKWCLDQDRVSPSSQPPDWPWLQEAGPVTSKRSQHRSLCWPGQYHLPPMLCSISHCITAISSQAMVKLAMPMKEPRHNHKLPAGSQHPHPSQATWACVSVYQTKLFLKSYSFHPPLCFTQPFCLNYLKVKILIKSVFKVLIEISKLFYLITNSIWERLSASHLSQFWVPCMCMCVCVYMSVCERETEEGWRVNLSNITSREHSWE